MAAESGGRGGNGAGKGVCATFEKYRGLSAHGIGPVETGVDAELEKQFEAKLRVAFT